MVARVSRLGGVGCGGAVGARNQMIEQWWWHASSVELSSNDGGAAVSLGCDESEREVERGY